MKLKRKHAIGLLAALLVLAFVSVALVVHDHSTLKVVAWVFSAISLMAGVTITYDYPISVQGTSVGPTAAQVAQLAEVTAVVNMTDGETSFTITHNFGNPGYGPTDTGQGFPVPIIFYTSAGTGPVVFQAVPSATTVVFTKASSAGSGGTLEVVILRPHTRMR